MGQKSRTGWREGVLLEQEASNHDGVLHQKLKRLRSLHRRKMEACRFDAPDWRRVHEMAVNPPKTKPLRQFSKVVGKIFSVAEAAPRCSGGR
jgi:hypothetical protein